MALDMAPSIRLVMFLTIAPTICSTRCLAQVPSYRCDPILDRLVDCPFLTGIEPQQDMGLGARALSSAAAPNVSAMPAQNSRAYSSSRADSDPEAPAVTAAPKEAAKEGFHWGQALKESFTFLTIEQAYVVHDDFRWVVVENGIPFNHYWRDYKQSLSTWVHSGWSDGDPNLYGYVGHPIQGALTSYIQIQNDPRSRNLEFENSKAYWLSRLKATLWNAVYSTQWNLGPISEVTVEKYGTNARPPWNQDGSWPCTRKPCYTGVGQVDIVMTPIGGLGWMVGEDWLDKNIARRVEGATRNQFLIDVVRCAFNPARGGANILHGQAPWSRPRDNRPRHFSSVDEAVDSPLVTPAADPVITTSEPTNKHIPSRGNVFFAYAYTGANGMSNYLTSMHGWNVAIEKKVLPFFGVIGDVSGQYGSGSFSASGSCTSAGSSSGSCVTGKISVYNFLLGVRGSHSTWRIQPFAECLFGAVHTNASAPGIASSNTAFTLALGVGLDFRLAPRMSWGVHTDYLTTGTFDASQHNIRMSFGPAIQF
jgi:hypothetical protein